MLHSRSGTTAETKEESIRDRKWRPVVGQTRGRVKQIKTKEMKQEDTSKNGAVFHLREQGIGDE